MKLINLIEDIDPTLKKNNIYYKKLMNTVKFLEKKEKILFLTTSNRGEWAQKELKEQPKSTKLAMAIQSYLGEKKVTLIEVPDLKIYTCEGNVSHMDGNQCGVKKSSLDDKEKNPTGHHRCWRNINNPDDELWKITKVLFESDTLLFFGSVRWGQMNAIYQNLIERLTWLENRQSTLGESNLLNDISSGVIAVGQNWNGKNVVDIQKNVLTFFGFDVRDELSWNWQYGDNPNDESKESYKKSGGEFLETFGL